MKFILLALFALIIPFAVNAQYYGYNPAYQNGNNAIQEQIRESNEQLRHQDNMLMEQNRQMQLDRMYQQQRLDNARRNSSSDGLPGLPPLGF